MGFIRVGCSLQKGSAAAAAEIRRQLCADDYALIIFFCADTFRPTGDLARALREHFPAQTQLMGCTTAGEIGFSGYQNDSVVAIAFPQDDFSVVTVPIPGASNFELAECQRRIDEALLESVAQKKSTGFQETFAFILIDGLSLREEALGRAVQLMLDDIPLLGGSAGDSLHFKETFVFHDDTKETNVAVLAIINTRIPFRTFKTQHFERTAIRMVVTGARPAERVVTEINGFPAAIEYARLVGIPTDSLNPMAFAAHPVMVRIGGHEYVRSIQKVNPDNSLSFYCAIDEGIVLSCALVLDAVEDISRTLDALENEIGESQIVLACDCILRKLEFQQMQLQDAMSAELAARRVFGFSTFGELYKGIHVNQTITGVAFGHAPNNGAAP